MYGQNGKYSKLGKHVSDEMASAMDEIRKSLKPRKMTLVELGEELDIIDSNVMRIMKGTHLLSVKQFVEMCMVFKVDPVEIFTRVWEKEKKKKF